MWVEVDADGQPRVEGGRVPIRYQAKAEAKVYRASAGRVSVDAKAPIESLAAGADADADPGRQRKTTSKKAASSKSGFGKAGTRTAAQAALAADVARQQISALQGKAVIAFSDGACRGNPGPAGSGAVIVLPDGRRFAGSLYLGRATNNVAELTAIELVLDLLEDAGVAKEARVAIFSDSSYANGVLVRNWKAKANQALIGRLKDRLKTRPNLEIKWIAGHAGIEGNELADELANQGVDGQSSRHAL